MRRSSFQSLILGAVFLVCSQVAAQAEDQPLILRFSDGVPNRPQPALALMFSPDGKTLAAIDGTYLASWDAQTGKPLQAAKTVLPYQLCRLKDDVAVLERVQTKGQPFWSGCNLRRASTGAVVQCGSLSKLTVPAALGSYPASEGVTFAPQWDLGACIVNVATKSSSSPLVIDGVQGLPRAAFSGEIVLFALSTGTASRTLPAPSETGPVPVSDLLADARQSQARALVLSPDGKKLAALAPSGTITVWSCLDGKVIASLVGEAVNPFHTSVSLVPEGEMARGGARRTLVWSGDSNTIVTLCSRETLKGIRKLVRWDIASATQRTIEWLGTKPGRTVEEQVAAGEASPAQARRNDVADASFAVCSPDFQRALISQVPKLRGNSITGGLEVVDLSNSSPLGLVRVSEAESICAVAFSPDCRRVALATGTGSVIVAPLSMIETFAREHRALIDFKSAAPAAGK
jgi:WD40 repeat protein